MRSEPRRRRLAPRVAPPLLVLLALAPRAGAAEPPQYGLPRLRGEVTIDGIPDESAWESAVAVDRFWEFSPGEQAEPPVATVGRFAYDDEFLYVAVRCADPEPERMRAPFVERDHVADQDFVQVDVDARDEGRWSMLFRVNPRGVQTDGVFDETAGYDDFSPDLHWESATRIGDDGWTAEMRIPLATLRYRRGSPGESQTWRISLYRLYPRRFRHLIATMPIPRGSNCWLCHAARFTGISGLGSAASLTVAPFATARGDDPAGAAGEEELDAGADLKWQPRPDLSLDATWNPDFSQVEADAPRIAVNERFALFYPEKRPFFLEGSDLWNSPIPAVYTRTITEPDWGGRVTGRPGDAAWTLLAAGDRGGGSLVVPGPGGSTPAPQPADASVVLGRWRRTFGRSSLATLATWREGEAGYFNRLGGVDFQWFPTDLDRAVGQILWSETRDAGEGGTAGDHAVYLRWERSARNYEIAAQLDELGHDFRADSGFVPQVGIRHGQFGAGHSFFRDGAVRRIQPRLFFDEVREIGGGLVSRTPSVGLTVDGALLATLDWFPGEEARAADGRRFEQRYGRLSVRLLPGPWVPYLKVSARYGDEIDFAGSRLGTGTALAVVASVAASDRLQAELSAERRTLDVPASGGGREVRLYTAGVARAKLIYTFTARAFARAIGEWRALDERAAGGGSESRFAGSLLYGYRLDWQSILYLGYDNAPAAIDPSRRDQELFFKVAYAFRPRAGDGR